MGRLSKQSNSVDALSSFCSTGVNSQGFPTVRRISVRCYKCLSSVRACRTSPLVMQEVGMRPWDPSTEGRTVRWAGVTTLVKSVVPEKSRRGVLLWEIPSLGAASEREIIPAFGRFRRCYRREMCLWWLRLYRSRCCSQGSAGSTAPFRCFQDKWLAAARGDKITGRISLSVVVWF